jgi:hypothetical protein
MTTPEQDPDQFRARQRSRAVAMALALGAFVVLMYLISIVKMTVAT